MDRLRQSGRDAFFFRTCWVSLSHAAPASCPPRQPCHSADNALAHVPSRATLLHTHQVADLLKHKENLEAQHHRDWAAGYEHCAAGGGPGEPLELRPPTGTEQREPPSTSEFRCREFYGRILTSFKLGAGQVAFKGRPEAQPPRLTEDLPYAEPAVGVHPPHMLSQQVPQPVPAHFSAAGLASQQGYFQLQEQLLRQQWLEQIQALPRGGPLLEGGGPGGPPHFDQNIPRMQSHQPQRAVHMTHEMQLHFQHHYMQEQKQQHHRRQQPPPQQQ